MLVEANLLALNKTRVQILQQQNGATVTFDIVARSDVDIVGTAELLLDAVDQRGEEFLPRWCGDLIGRASAGAASGASHSRACPSAWPEA